MTEFKKNLSEAIDLYADFDHYNPRLGPDGTPFEFFEALRDQMLRGQRIGRSEHYGGMWVIGGYAECQEVMKAPETFSNTRVIWPDYEMGDAVLLMAGQDDPEHAFYRKIFNPAFAPQRVAKLTDQIRGQVNRLIDTFVDNGEIDVAHGLCDELPGQLTAAFLGVPEDNSALYIEWIEACTKGAVGPDPDGAARKIQEMAKYVQELVNDRRRAPGDDVFSDAVNADIGGRQLNDWELLSLFTLLLLAGYDNTFRMLTSSVWRLAWDKELRRRVGKKPALASGMFDEIMRMYTPAHPTRVATQDVEFHGIKMAKGDTVMILGPVANRDPAKFEFPDAFLPDRAANPHIALGAGLHRCLGAHLVRIEGRVMIEELLKRIPDFGLDTRDGKRPVWQGGQVAGFIEMPIVF